MTYIQVDARGCGVGKTRNTIIPRIRNNIRNRIRTLVVVPSKNLQKEYATHFDTDEITVINREDEREKILAQYQIADTPVVCLTHQGFLQTPYYLFEKDNWDLIIDEAFDPYASLTFETADSAGRVWINYSEIVSWKNPLTPDFRPETTVQPFFELEFTQSSVPDLIDRQTWRKLTNPNYRKWATWQTGDNLQNNRVETATIQLELDPVIFEGWSSIWIAAAVFDKTFMGYWMTHNRREYEIVYQFEIHQSPAVWHIPEEEFSWSKNYRNQNPEIEKTFREYINQTRSGRLIYNSNNDSTTVLTFGTRINHNAHGVNAYSHLTDYAFISAIKPHPCFLNFLKIHLELKKTQFEFAFAGYTAYQLMMRSALRDPNNKTPVNIYFLDTAQALSIMELFDPFSYKTVLIKEIQGNVRRPLTPAERNKKWREKQKQLKATQKG